MNSSVRKARVSWQSPPKGPRVEDPRCLRRFANVNVYRKIRNSSFGVRSTEDFPGLTSHALLHVPLPWLTSSPHRLPKVSETCPLLVVPPNQSMF